MPRLNDVGGQTTFGPVEEELDEPPFHHDWEAHVLAMNRSLIGRGIYNLDEFRDAVERTMSHESSYYENWFRAIGTLLREKGHV
ncbi:hypothetical protein AB0A63_34515 [Lentzea sp. NPDC042327]|uniref:hypothetical protein n=1 Tax=Lentzea sp. NPDC042327 TaxID=3154801 RepID=UPI0033DDC75F